MLGTDGGDDVRKEGASLDDAVAFRLVVERFADNVYALALRLLGGDRGPEAEEITQDVMLDIWKRRDIENRTGLPVRLYRMVATRCLDRLASRNPERLPIGRAWGSGIIWALEEMPAIQRAALTLAHFDHTDACEIALILGISMDEAEGLVQQGRKALRRRLTLLVVGQG